MSIVFAVHGDTMQPLEKRRVPVVGAQAERLVLVSPRVAGLATTYVPLCREAELEARVCDYSAEPGGEIDQVPPVLPGCEGVPIEQP